MSTKKKKSTKKKSSSKKAKKSTSKALEPEVITNKSSDSKSLTSVDPVTQYMAEVRKYPLLTKEQEKELAVKYYETKDPEAAEALVTSNLRFVVKVASDYAKFGSKMIDLVQEGNVGLMHAVREFNPYKGVRLITYAVWWIRGYIQDYLMKQYSLVKIGTTQNQRKLFYQLQKQKAELEAMGFDSSVKQISGKLNIPEDEVADMTMRMSGRDVSFDQPLNDSGQGATLIDLQADEFERTVDEEIGLQEELGMLTEHLEKLKPDLNDREVFLLENRLLSDSPMTLQEIGDKYSITREAVRQMEVRLLKKIKKEMLPEA